MQKSVPKVPKVLTFGKVSQKIPKDPKILGGVSDLFWTKSKLKLHFFYEKLPYEGHLYHSNCKQFKKDIPGEDDLAGIHIKLCPVICDGDPHSPCKLY